MSYRFTDGYINPASDGYIRISSDGYTLLISDGYNVSFFVQSGNLFGSGAKRIFFIPNRTSISSTNPVEGGFFYAEDGDGYWVSATGVVQSLSNTRISRTFPSDANYTAVQSDYQAKIMEFVGGSLTATRDVIVPLTSGYQWTVFNGTSGGQSIRIIGATGTGITIANGMRAIVYADGTNIVRATPDI